MIVALDFETYFDPPEYSLKNKKSSTAQYILDPRFQAHGAAVQLGLDALPEWIRGAQLPAFFQALRDYGKPVTMMTFNSLFDQCIAAWRFGYVPDLMIDVLGMARALYGPALVNKSLANLSAYLKLPVQKGRMPDFAGMSTVEIEANPGFYAAFTDYAKQDVTAMIGAYNVMEPDFPKQEFLTMDLVLRTAVEPQFQFNRELLEEHLVDLKVQKEHLLDAAGLCYDEDGRIPELMSTAKFKAMLEGLGVVVEEKISPTTGRAIPALAKPDEFMQSLLEHEDPQIAVLAAARLGHKSTIEETRTARYIAVSKLTGPHWTPNAAPMPLRYAAAHTHRLGGDWSMNCMHPDVEVLTPVGWQRIEYWQGGTPIMQWWPDGRLTFDNSAGKVERSEDTELVWFDSPFVKGGFTRDHRMVAINKGQVVERTAGWIADHSGLDNIPVTGLYTSSTSRLTADQVRVLVALAADGSQVPRTPHWQWGFHKQRKANRLRALLVAAEVEFNTNFSGKRYSFRTKPVVRACRGRPTQGHDWLVKGFGAWVLDLGPVEMDALLDELVYWDGFTNSNSGAITFSTSLHDQALWVQTVAHIRGRACTVKGYDKVTTFSKGAPVRQWYVYFRATNFTSAVGAVRPYTGMTYCPVVKSTYVLARYGEGVFVTGQCQNMPAGRAGQTNKIRQSLEPMP